MGILQVPLIRHSGVGVSLYKNKSHCLKNWIAIDSESSMPLCSAILVRPNEYARTRILGVPIKIFILKFLMYINNNKLYLLISLKTGV